jgi:hypothetical protein
VDWTLSAGGSYWLLRTVLSNELFTAYGLPLASIGDIAIATDRRLSQIPSKPLRPGRAFSESILPGSQ